MRPVGVVVSRRSMRENRRCGQGRETYKVAFSSLCELLFGGTTNTPIYARLAFFFPFSAKLSRGRIRTRREGIQQNLIDVHSWGSQPKRCGGAL
jgi:hypothetical protein